MIHGRSLRALAPSCVLAFLPALPCPVPLRDSFASVDPDLDGAQWNAVVSDSVRRPRLHLHDDRSALLV